MNVIFPLLWNVMLLMATDGVLMALPARLVLPLGVPSTAA